MEDYLNDLVGLLCRNYMPQAQECSQLKIQK
jgi:hypothetical protein